MKWPTGRLPTNQELRSARDTFRELLKSGAPEDQWQLFFAHNPFVFSAGLPLKLHPWDITTLGRDFKDEPDFAFFNEQHMQYGVIELKRPDQPIVIRPRKRIIRLAGDAQTAVAQAKRYAETLRAEILLQRHRSVLIGNEAHLFVVMGLRDHLAARLVADFTDQELVRLLGGVRLYGYDELLACYERGLPFVSFVLSSAESAQMYRCVLPSLLHDTWAAFELSPEMVAGLDEWHAMFEVEPDSDPVTYVPKEGTGVGVWRKEAQIIDHELVALSNAAGDHRLRYVVRRDDRVDALVLAVDGDNVRRAACARTGLMINSLASGPWTPRPGAPQTHVNQLMLGCRQLWPTEMHAPYYDPMVAIHTKQDGLDD
jgi:Domain of unknown function (DUF4263)